jgi:hypothetical protein
MIKIDNHIDQAQDRQVVRWKGLTNEDKIIKIRVARLQVLEDLLFEMLDGRAISNASGAQLDGIGEFYGDQGARANRTDDEYRAFLLTLPAKLRQAGQVNVLLDSLANLTGSPVTLIQSFPRVVLMHIYVDAPISADSQTSILAAMESIKAYGVNLEIGQQLNYSAFIFSNNVSGGNSGEGFSSTATGEDGGIFVSLLTTIEQFLILSESGFILLSEDGFAIKSNIGI